MDEMIALRKRVLEKDFGRMNSRQKKAVFHTEGPLLVLAGAGSGKTTVLVNRIANIVQYGSAYHSEYIRGTFSDEDAAACRDYLEKDKPLPGRTKERLSDAPCQPWRVMAITFTNKAAGELKDRLENMLGDSGRQIWASTFHSSCARILRRDGSSLGYTSGFAIYDTDDSTRLMTQCLNELEISKDVLKPKAVLREISRAKDKLITPQKFLMDQGDDYRLQLVARAYVLYQKRLLAADAMDFDDLIFNTVKLFQTSKETLEYYQSRFRYIMVDEYQDTNYAQYEFVNLLAAGHRNLCVVGDDDQSIYKFRGATIENILNFETDYDGAAVIRLEQNYRSTQTILDAANAVIQNNVNRKGKNLWTDNGTGKKIEFHIAENAEDEADCVAEEILNGVAEGRNYSDYAILYRMNAQSSSFERTFVKQGIPHRILGGMRFYERQEIKDMIAYLSVVNNPGDTVRMRRIINQPKRGIGTTTVDHVMEIAEETGLPFFDIISNAQDYPALFRAATKLLAFSKLLRHLIVFHEDPSVSLDDLYREILEKTDYVNYLRKDDPERAQDRIENVYELSSNIQLYQESNLERDNWFPDDEQEASKKPILTSFLEEVSLLTDVDNYDSSADAVTLMTIHSAKGLEFPCVLLPGLEEGIFPGIAVQYNPAEAEEERRLAYVALTRAKDSLYLSVAESRMLFGSMSRNAPSRFIREIPESLLNITHSYGVSDYYAKSASAVYAGQMDGTGAAVGGFKKKSPVERKPVGTYAPGDVVRHKTFGTGLVLTATPMANDILLEIAFDQVGTKKIFANFAKLEKKDA